MKKILLILLITLVSTLTISLVSCNIFEFETTTTTKQQNPNDPSADIHEHSYTSTVIEPTCTEKGYMLFECNCGISYEFNHIDALGHTFSEWSTVKDATATEEGLKERYCECGEKESEIINRTSTSGELEFSLNEDGVSYSLTGIGSCTDTNIVIPSVYLGLPVNNIRCYALRGAPSIESLVIPKSITNLDICSLTIVPIKNIYYLGDITDWLNICFYQEYAADGSMEDLILFSPDTNFYINNELVTDIEIPSTVTDLPGWIFPGCTTLTNVKISSSLTSISTYSFINCTSLTSITFDGTTDQWYNITKGRWWAYNTNLSYIYCTDGIITP